MGEKIKRSLRSLEDSKITRRILPRLAKSIDTFGLGIDPFGLGIDPFGLGIDPFMKIRIWDCS